MNLVLLGRGEQAETALRDMADGPDGYLPDGHYWATVRAANLVWMLGKPADASAILDGLASPNAKASETPAEVAERLAVQACLDAVAARCELAAERARAALYSDALPDFHAMMASLALIMAMGALGEVDDLAGVAEQALRRATTSFQASHMRFWFGAVYGRACRLTGYRRMRQHGKATSRLGPRHPWPGLCESGLPAGERGPGPRRCGRRGPTGARSACRGAKTRRHNGFAAGELLRVGRGTRQARTAHRSE
jgi:hypothetical protein